MGRQPLLMHTMNVSPAYGRRWPSTTCKPTLCRLRTHTWCDTLMAITISWALQCSARVHSKSLLSTMEKEQPDSHVQRCSERSLSMQSEYAPSTMERRHFISRFTGSAGTAVVTSDAAALWTDGRYFLQVMRCEANTPESFKMPTSSHKCHILLPHVQQDAHLEGPIMPQLQQKGCIFSWIMYFRS